MEAGVFRGGAPGSTRVFILGDRLTRGPATRHDPLVNEKAPVRTALVLAIVAASILLASVALSPDRLPSHPTCLVQRLTERPCAGCGLTRSLTALARGRVAEAWQLNPLGFVVYALCLVLVAGPLWVRLAPRAATRFWNSRWPLAIGAGLPLLTLVFGLARWIGAPGS